MPTYEYACTSCGEHLEVVQSFKDDPLTECAVCGGELRKVFAPIGVVFKGSGFYKTDSRSGSGSKAASSDSSSKASGGDTGTSSAPSSDSSKASAPASSSDSSGSSGSSSSQAAAAS